MKIEFDDIKKIVYSGNTLFKGITYYKQKHVRNLQIQEYDGITVIKATVQGNSHSYNTEIFYDNEYDNIFDYSCECPAFDKYSGACKHIVATIFCANEQPSKVTTDNYAMQLINQYSNKISSDIMASSADKLATIEPTLETDVYDRICLTLKIGTDRLYVIKDLPEFKERMLNGANSEYGKNFSLTHNTNSFNDAAKQFLQFFMFHYNDSNAYTNRYSYYSNNDNKKRFYLMPYVIDELFKLYLNRKIKVKIDELTSGEYTVKQGNPDIHINIVKFTKEAYSIELDSPAFYMFQGAIHTYTLQNGVIYICDDAYNDNVFNFIYNLKRAHGKFTVLQNDMRAFYTSVLEPAQNYLNITCDEDLTEYQSLPLVSNIYFDMPAENTVTAKLEFVYGMEKYNAFDNRTKASIGDVKAEMQLKALMKKYFEFINEYKEAFFEDNEQKLYKLVSEGISEFSRHCEVYMTDKFKRARIKQPPAVNVGVRLESDLLNISFDIGDMDISDLIEVLKSYRLAKKYHKLKDGSFVELENSGLGELSSLADALSLSEKDILSGNISVPKYRALYLDNMIKQSSDLKYERDNNFKKIVRDIRDVTDSDIEVPAELKKTLRNYQKTGYRWLETMSIYNFGGILADDMGLGKTLQIIALLKAHHDKNDLPSIVVCPSSLVLNWESELKKFAPDIRSLCVLGTNSVRKEMLNNIDNVDVLITSYDLLKRDIDNYENIKFEYEIIDEAQYIKNHTTQNAKTVKVINSNQRFALTGTPVENSLAELWSVFDYLMPGYLYNYNKFKQKFETPIVKSRDTIALDSLKKMVSPFILRRLKKDVLKELPDKTETVMYASLEGEQKKLYLANLAKTKKELSEHFDNNSFESSKLVILTMLTRLRQLCCDPRLMYEDYKHGSAKLEMCMELIQSSIDSGHKLLLFSQFTSMLALIEERLNALKLAYYKIEGSTKKETRFELVNKFNEDSTPVFLISLKAGGTGLNLTGADVVIHYDPWWNVSAQNQATDRAHRIGQKNNVTVYKLIAKDTIEEKILKLQQDKAELADLVINESDGAISKMSKEDIISLFE